MTEVPATPSVTVVDPSPEGDSAREVRAVALVLPGGKARSREAFEPAQLAAVRMRPFAADLHKRGGGLGLAVWSLGYRMRGWNEPQRSPVGDARWALAEVRRRHGDVPVVLVGHSMGGRTALQVADDPSVVGACALAPWVERSDPVEPLAGRSVFIAHGTVDFITSARQSRLYAARAVGVAERIGRVLVLGDTHAMLFRYGLWHSLATGFTLGTLGFAPLPSRVERAYDAAGRGDLAVRV